VSIRAAFPTWPEQNRRLRERVAALTEEQLAVWHIAELNEGLTRAGLEQIEFWD
jgi:hypothetical protein